VLQDYAEAAKWYRRAAEQGNDGAQLFLGIMYQDGRGVPQDYAEAVTWYRRAAEQGIAEAQNNLGYMYDNGHGVPQNYVLAHMWFNLAASQGHEVSLGSGDDESGNRDIVARRMTSEQIVRAQALAARCLASDYQDCGE
jgi:TPR repeat protein